MEDLLCRARGRPRGQLADTDVGSIITAGQSGVQWGYSLLLLQAILMPILYVVQELTVRLGIFAGKGHGELIRDAFGPHGRALTYVREFRGKDREALDDFTAAIRLDPRHVGAYAATSASPTMRWGTTPRAASI